MTSGDRPRIGLLTIHGSDNFGSVLQAACLAGELEAFGDVEVIDHRPLTLNLGYYQDLLPYQLLRRRLNPDVGGFFSKNRKMAACRDDMLPLGDRLWRKPGADVFGRYDLLVVGSDEVWSTRWGRQTQFLFDGAPDDVARISYAASIGRSSEVAGGDDVGVLLHKFSSVLARDQPTADACARAGRPVDSIVCDPVLLVDPSTLVSLATPATGPASTLLYHESCRADPRIDRAIELAGGPERVVSFGFPSPGREAEMAVDSRDYVGMIDHADLVVTSMFHGVITALALGKRLAILSQASKRQKVDDLLARVGAVVTEQSDDITVVSAAPGVDEFRQHSQRALTAAVEQALSR